MNGDGVVAQLAELALFADLTWPELERVAHTFDEEAFEPGRRVLRQGLSGSALYIVLEGSATVHVAEVRVAHLARGDFFGEISVLTGSPRTATIVAASRCELLELDRPTLDSITSAYPRVREVLQRFYEQRMATSADVLQRPGAA